MQTVQLNEAFWFQEGPGVRKWQFTHSGIKLLNVGNILASGFVDLSKTQRRLSHEEVEKHYKHFLVDEGDLVIASSGISFDDDGLLRTRGAFVQRSHLPLCLNTSTIRFKSKGNADLRYLRFWLDSHEFRSQITRLVTGSAQQNFGPSHLKEAHITLPPLSEQQRIAEQLGKAHRLAGTRRYALELSNNFLAAVFLELFGDPATNPKGWEKSLINDVLVFSQYGTSDKSNSQHRGYPVLGMGNISADGRIDLSSVSHVALTKGEFKKLKLEAGDIIFNRTNSTDLVGKTSYWNRNIDAVLASYLVRLKLKPQLTPEFFSALLNTRYFKRLFQQRCRKAVGQSNISPTLLREFAVYVPPLSRQQEFAGLVRRFESLRAQLGEAQRQAEHLFQTLLHTAFASDV